MKENPHYEMLGFLKSLSLRIRKEKKQTAGFKISLYRKNFSLLDHGSGRQRNFPTFSQTVFKRKHWKETIVFINARNSFRVIVTRENCYIWIFQRENCRNCRLSKNQTEKGKEILKLFGQTIVIGSTRSFYSLLSIYIYNIYINFWDRVPTS